MPLPLTASCFSKIQIGLTFLVQDHPGSPGQRAVKRVCVCFWYRLTRVVLDKRPLNWCVNIQNQLATTNHITYWSNETKNPVALFRFNFTDMLRRHYTAKHTRIINYFLSKNIAQNTAQNSTEQYSKMLCKSSTFNWQKKLQKPDRPWFCWALKHNVLTVGMRYWQVSVTTHHQ